MEIVSWSRSVFVESAPVEEKGNGDKVKLKLLFVVECINNLISKENLFVI